MRTPLDKRYGASVPAVVAAEMICSLDSIRPHVRIEGCRLTMIGQIARTIDQAFRLEPEPTCGVVDWMTRTEPNAE